MRSLTIAALLLASALPLSGTAQACDPGTMGCTPPRPPGPFAFYIYGQTPGTPGGPPVTKEIVELAVALGIDNGTVDLIPIRLIPPELRYLIPGQPKTTPDQPKTIPVQPKTTPAQTRTTYPLFQGPNAIYLNKQIATRPIGVDRNIWYYRTQVQQQLLNSALRKK